ncbi:MAG TPA: PrsW family glutamic-type intramembrane protease [Candidatus Paceibacterota bacterium]|nr:PrsW family glutamic-type intramembrane protease [Candidatus Paceibacterota bacterium]
MVVAALILGLLPGFAWLIFYLGEEPHPEPKRFIVLTFVVGIAFGFFTIGIEELFNSAAGSIGIQELSIVSLLALALIEELMKFAAAHFVIAKNAEFAEPVDAMIYMVVAALGFATLENIGAIANISLGGTQTAIVASVFQTVSLRFIGATLLHSLTSAIIGYYWSLGLARGKEKRYLVPGFIAATVIHATFNYLVLNYGDIAYAVIFLMVIGFFVLHDFEKLKEQPAVVSS